MKPQLLQFDNLDDRREVHQLLARLAPRRRLAFLDWCCSTIPGERTRPGVSAQTRALARQAERDSAADRRFALVAYQDVWLLCAQWDLDLARAVNRLVALVRGRPE